MARWAANQSRSCSAARSARPTATSSPWSPPTSPPPQPRSSNATPTAGQQKPRSWTPATSPASARPAPAPSAPWSAWCRSGWSATAWRSAGTPTTASPPTTLPPTAPARPGTAPSTPSRSPTCSPRCAVPCWPPNISTVFPMSTSLTYSQTPCSPHSTPPHNPERRVRLATLWFQCSPPFASANWRGFLVQGVVGEFISAARLGLHRRSEPLPGRPRGLPCTRRPLLLRTGSSPTVRGTCHRPWFGPEPSAPTTRRGAGLTGTPSSSKEPKANAAHMKQRAVWESQGVKPFTRPLRYPRNWPAEKAQEKGVDVALAVDLVFNASRRYYDAAVVASTDTDLVPALEAVCELRRAWGEPQVEVTCWSPLTKRLRVDGRALWCHQLDQADYEAVRDRTNYTL